VFAISTSGLRFIISFSLKPYIFNWQNSNSQNKSFVTINNSNRFRVSTRFHLVKIFIAVGLLSIAFNLLRDIHNDTINSRSIAGLAFGTAAMVAILYFIGTRKRIDYDDIKQILYVVDTKKQTEVEIPVENIDKILYSAIGVRGMGSYLIVYKDAQKQIHKIRLFPIPFDNTIDTIKTDAELKNPNLKSRNWSLGWNELFD